MQPLSRRSFLAASAGLVLVAACGNGDDDEGAPAEGATGSTAAGGSSMTTVAEGAAELTLVRFFADGSIVAGQPQRMVFGLADADHILLADAPAELTLRVLRDGTEAAAATVVPRHDQGVPRPYYPLRVALEAGTYEAVADVGGGVGAAFTVVDPATFPVPGPGDRMIPVDTPTLADARGVDPICTSPEICPLHEVTVTDALAEGRPVALLIATPAFCQQSTCGPVLDILLGQRDAFPQVRMVHAEVYVKPADSLDQVTEAVSAYELPFEPTLFLAGADGVIRERIDNVFDSREAAEALGRLTTA